MVDGSLSYCVRMDIGTWVRASSFVGIVTKVEPDGTLVIFNPGDRQMLQATPGAVTALPTGRVRVTVTHEVDVPHGLAEESLMRWTAALLDPVLRDKAIQRMEEAGMSTAPFDSPPEFDVHEIVVREASE